jgi:hypothetical protein
MRLAFVPFSSRIALRNRLKCPRDREDNALISDIATQEVRVIGVLIAEIQHKTENRPGYPDPPMGIVVAVITMVTVSIAGALVAFHPLVTDQAIEGEFKRQSDVQASAEIVAVPILAEKVRRIIVSVGDLWAERKVLERVVQVQMPFQIALSRIVPVTGIIVVDFRQDPRKGILPAVWIYG